MRFFDVNVLGRYQGGAITATSGNGNTAFSETVDFSYQSSGQDLDGDTVILGREFDSEQEFDSLVILQNNFKNVSIWRKETEVSSWENITSSFVITESADHQSHFYKSASIIKFYSLEIRIPDTVVADQEKECGCIMAFTELGNLIKFTDIDTQKKFKQKKMELDAGGIVVVNKGSWWTFKIKSKYISDQATVDLITTIQNLGREFFIWINSGYESAMVEVEPYRFNDFIKCVHTGTPNPGFYKNYLNSVFEDGLQFEQTGQIK